MSGAGTLYVAVKGDTKDLIAALKAAKAESISYGKQAKAAIDPVGASMAALQRNVVALGSAYLGLQGLKSVIGIADQYSLLDSKLKLVTGSTTEFAKVQNGLFDISQRTGTSFAANAAQYSNLGLALKDLHISSGEMLGMFDTLNKSIVVAGASTSEATAFLQQFKQGMASGKFAGDEFKSMMENNSYFGLQLAKALKTDVDGLYKMKEAGELTTETLRKAFPEMAAQIQNDFDGIQKTIGRAMTELENAFNDVVANSNKVAGGTTSAATAISDLAKTITNNKETISTIFVGMIMGAKEAIDFLGRVTTGVQTLAIVAASKDKNLFEWMGADNKERLGWIDEASNGISQLKDQLEGVREKISQVHGDDRSLLPSLMAEKKAIQERIKEIQNSTAAEDEYIAKSIAGVEKKLGIEARSTSSFKDSWQTKRDLNISMAKEITDAEDKYYDDLEKKEKKAYEKSKEIKHLKATDAFDALEMQKEAHAKAIKEEESLEEEKYKTTQELLNKQVTEHDQAYTKMLGLIKSSKKTEIETWQEATDAELDEFERLSDGSKEYTDAINEYREIKHKELLDRIKRDEKEHLSESQKAWLSFAHDAERNFSTVFANVLMNEYKTIGDAFDDLCKQMLRSFVNLVAEMAAKDFMASVFGVGTGGNMSGMAGSALNWLFGSSGSSGSSYINGTGAGLGNMYGDEMGTGTNIGSSGTGSMVGGAVGVAGGGYAMYSGAENVSKGNYATGAIQTGVGAYSTYQGAVAMGVVEEGTATAMYESAASYIGQVGTEVGTQVGTEVGTEVGTQVATEFGTTAGTTAGEAIAANFASNAAADSAGTYAASATTAEFGAVEATGTSAGTTGTAAGVGAGEAAGYATGAVAGAILAMGIMVSTSHTSTNQRLNQSGVSPTGLGMIGGIETNGRLTHVGGEAAEALGLLSNQLDRFDTISIDAANGVAVLGQNIMGEDGLIQGTAYGIKVFDEAKGTWGDSTTSFKSMIAEMKQINPVTTEAINSTAAYIAQMHGLPTVADELAIAFTGMRTGIYGLAEQVASGTTDLANAIFDANPGINTEGSSVGRDSNSGASEGDFGWDSQLEKLDTTAVSASGGILALTDGMLVLNGGVMALGGSVGQNIEVFNAATGAYNETSTSMQDMVAEMLQINPTTADAITSTAEYLAQMHGVPAVAGELVTAFLALQYSTSGLAGAATRASGTVAEAVARMSNMRFEGTASSEGSSGYSQPAEAEYTWDEALGHAAGGTITRGLVPRGDDVLAGYKFGEVVLPVDTSRLLDRKLKDGSLGGGQTINLTIPISVGNEPLTTLIVKVSDGQAAIRQQKNITGRMYAR